MPPPAPVLRLPALPYGGPPRLPDPHRRFARLGRPPRYEDVVNEQVAGVIQQKGPGNLNKLLRGGDVWEVK